MNKAGRRSGGNPWKGVAPIDRLHAAYTVDTETGCWVCHKPRADGYGSLYYQGRSMVAHRASWLMLRGEIPAGLELDHLCRNRACVNPDHLEPVTRRVNILRGDTMASRRAAQTHCKRGHAFTEANTHVTSRRERICRTCHAAKNWGYKNGMSTDQVIALREDVAVKVAAL